MHHPGVLPADCNVDWREDSTEVDKSVAKRRVEVQVNPVRAGEKPRQLQVIEGSRPAEGRELDGLDTKVVPDDADGVGVGAQGDQEADHGPVLGPAGQPQRSHLHTAWQLNCQPLKTFHQKDRI